MNFKLFTKSYNDKENKIINNEIKSNDIAHIRSEK